VRNRFKFFGIIVLTAVIGFSMSACNNPVNVGDDGYHDWAGGGGHQNEGAAITWTVTHSSSPSTGDAVLGHSNMDILNFNFSRDPGHLAATAFTITAGSGSATRGALSGSGTTRRLAISNVREGTVSVSINASNITGGSQNVTIAGAGQITWTVSSLGNPTTTALNFSFSRDPGPLLATAFTITAGSGSATRGALSGRGTTWSLAISNVSEGTVQVAINAPNISGSQTVTLVAPQRTPFQFRFQPPGVYELIGFTGTATDIVIPATHNGHPVRAIGRGAFSRRNLTSVTIPNSVWMIREHAFSNNQLSSVTIPNSVWMIGEQAFSNNQLSSVTIPDSGGTRIYTGAFAWNQLPSITIPNNVTFIGNGAFMFNQLTNVTIPSSVRTMEFSPFRNNPLTSVTIPFASLADADRAWHVRGGMSPLWRSEMPANINWIFNP